MDSERAHDESARHPRWIMPVLLVAAVAYLGWRLATIVTDPSIAAAALWVVEVLAWIGVAAFLLRVGHPYRPAVGGPVADVPATTVVVVLAAGRTEAALERTLASLDSGADAPAVLVVDDSVRTGVSTLARASGATVIPAAGPGPAAGAVALVNVVPDDAAVVVVEAGSLLAAGALHALVAPMADPAVGAVQGALDWADPATITVHGPSRDGLGVLISRQAPAAGSAGVAPILGDGFALRADALPVIGPHSTDLTIALASAGRIVRFVETPVVYRPRPSSAAQWRATRSAQVADTCRSARSAFRAPDLSFPSRIRIAAGAGDVASAYARIGFVAVLVATLLSGSVPVPGPLAPTLLAAATLWAFATGAVHLAVAPVLLVGDRLRLGWHRLDADLFGPFTRASRADATPGRLRSLLSFPISVLALLAVDAAAFVRGLTLVRPSLVPAIPTSLERATIGVVTLGVLALLVDSLRIFVARPDARLDLRVPARVAALVGTLPAELRDLSPTGAGMISTEALPQGTAVQLRFTLPDGTELAVDGRVARVDVVATADGSTAHHLGLQFGAMEPETHRGLVRYVATTAPGAAKAASAGALPRASSVPVPRSLLRFASVMAMIVACTSLIAAPAVAAPATTTHFTGTVSGPSGPLAGACVSAVSSDWQWWTAISDSSGGYTLDVPPGAYRFQLRDCSPGAVPGSSIRLAGGWWSATGLQTSSGATSVVGGDGQTDTLADVTLPEGGWITGAAQDANGAPLDGICVTPVSSLHDWDGGTTTPSNGGPAGTFETATLLPGSYRLAVNDCSGRADPFARGWVSGDGTTVSPFESGAKVFAVAGTGLAIGTFTLPFGTRIAGTVHDDTGAPAAGICVSANGPNWSWVGGGNTGPDGSYTTDVLPAGDWVLSFSDCNRPQTLVSTLFNGTPTGTTDFDAATRVHTDGSTPRLDGYDQTMRRGGTASGTVHTTSGPQANVCVNAVRTSGNDNWDWIAGTQTGPDGSFSLGPIPSGDFAIHTDACNNTSAVLGGFYTGPGTRADRDGTHAATLTVSPDSPITGLDVTVEIGAKLSGTVTGGGAPLADACVATLDPTTGATDSTRTGSDGTWSTVVPQGSYLVQANGCRPERRFANRFLGGSAEPAGARTVATAPGDTITGLDIDLPTENAGALKGRLTTSNGPAHPACVVVVAPDTEPIALGQTASDGAFDLGSLNPGSYLVGFAGCDFPDNGFPSGITDPTDPSVTYPLQWSSGRTITRDSLWLQPAWVTITADGTTDLGTICLQPCTVADPPATALPADPTTPPPVTGTPGGFTADPPPPTGTGFPQSASSASTQTLATHAIAPAPPAAVVAAARAQDVKITAAAADVQVISGHAQAASAARSDATDGTGGGSGSWWWLFVLSAAIAAVAAGVPWLRSRSATG